MWNLRNHHLQMPRPKNRWRFPWFEVQNRWCNLLHSKTHLHQTIRHRWVRRMFSLPFWLGPRHVDNGSWLLHKLLYGLRSRQWKNRNCTWKKRGLELNKFNKTKWNFGSNRQEIGIKENCQNIPSYVDFNWFYYSNDGLQFTHSFEKHESNKIE